MGFRYNTVHYYWMLYKSGRWKFFCGKWSRRSNHKRTPHLALRSICCERRLCSWWRHQMETFSALLAICAGNSPVPGEFSAQRPVTRSFDVFFDLRLNKRLSKQPMGWWFGTPSYSLWRHCYGKEFRVYPVWYSTHSFTAPLHLTQGVKSIHLWTLDGFFRPR